MQVRSFKTYQGYLRALPSERALWDFDTTAASAARYCGVTRSAVTNWILRGHIPALRIENHLVLVRKEDLRDRK